MKSILIKSIKKLVSNRYLRNVLNLSWNPNYDTTFHDTANNFEEAVNKINKSTNFKNYDSTLKYISEEINSFQDFETKEQNKPSFIPMFFKFIELDRKKTLKILDIGGGVNPISYYLKKFYNIKTVSDVVETNSYVKKIQKELKDKYDYLKYYSNVKDLSSKEYDIVYFGTSLQYFEDDELNFLNYIFKFNPNYILISKNFFINGPKDIYSLQSTGRYRLAPHKFFSLDKIEKFMSDKNYKLMFKVNHGHNYIHNKMKKNEYNLMSLIFVKN